MKLNEVIAKYGNQEVDESKIKEVLGVNESKVWKPNYGEFVYLVFSTGEVDSYFVNDSLDKFYDMGVVYKTKEEAQFARDKQLFLTKFERYLRENEDEPVDWRNKSQDKWSLFMDYEGNRVITNSWCISRYQGSIFTTNIYALEQFIKDNESDIKKYMFGVE